MAEALGIHELWLFILSGLLLNITPGPDTAYIIGRSIQFGWRGGAAAVIGICTGCLVHVFGAAIGLSALLMASSAAFTVLKWAGAAYLLFTGVQMLLSRSRPLAEVAAAGGDTSLARVFWQGALTNVLNPKVALFFLAFLPQFVAAESPHKTVAFLVLGLIFITSGMLWCFCIAAFAARAAGRIRQSAGAVAWVNRALGGLFVYLGIRVAMLEAR
ncbi:lysine transporter LysE [Bradyrhizobium sp. CCBAU 051011]|jgi:threonine/homoserine/homoserine lactone efflux protein|uniref:LysE family translocator n=1 Tax=Bradyrhizobium sp. CCBAU 051011 TaxID=858422 RepID=UPI00137407C8|nr:LysE family translocator [Bradyrhizobium sp. CCBAU 051011]QHO71961.1 lysine transporter LysE [Bradyrhizobium sp. CCBAU 051011]